MQNELNDFIYDNVIEDVLLPATQSALIKRSKDIIFQAKKIAQKIIREAELECEQIRSESYRDGYERGLIMSINAVCQFIDHSQKHTHEIEMKIHNDLKGILSDIVSEDEFNVRVAEKWGEGVNKVNDPLPINILMPYTSRKLKDRFSQAVKHHHNGGVIFEFHDEHRFVFKYNNRLAEFYPEEFINSTINTLTSRYNLEERQVEISNEAIRYLHEQLSLLYPPLNEYNVEQVEDE